MYIADLNKLFIKRGIGGMKLGKERIWSLAYADDIVLMAKSRVLEDRTGMLRRFLKDRKIELNIEKTKVMIFNKKRIGRKFIWEWGKKKIEEVENFRYLGFAFSKNRGYETHIRELARKVRVAANKVWG